MNIYVTEVHIPSMSTLGYGIGTDEEGEPVAFVGDHRPMRDLGEALTESTEAPLAWVEEHQLIPLWVARMYAHG